jgi:DNA-binding NtrC family response regulator
MTRRATIFVVDDDADVLTAARLLLRQHFDRVLTSDDPDEIGSTMASERIDVFLVDMNFAIGRNSGDEGLKCLELILKQDPDAVVVLMTAFGDLNTAVRAMREGAADFVLKPWQNAKLVATLNVAAALRRSRATVTALSETRATPDMIAESAVMQDVLKMVARVAPTDANVLIRGENGTGKELIAQALHKQSARSSNVLMTVDLGSVAESLFESELFGHTKGAFTDAESDRAGRFQAATGGTLFLDEIGNLPAASQTKLLRVLESREVTPLGSDQVVPIDVRLISATNQPLEKLVAEGKFREDLLYRINTIEISLPPLRERPDDIPVLADHFSRMYSRKYRIPEKRMTRDGYAALASHHWRGNVRELSHTIERALILSDGEVLDASSFSLMKETGVKENRSLNLESNEKNMVKLAIEQSGGNISHAAGTLGITRAALYRRIEKFDL